VQVAGADSNALLHSLAQKCAALQQAHKDLKKAQQVGESSLLDQLVEAGVRKLSEYKHNSTADAKQALLGSVRVVTLYPRCMWSQDPRSLKLDEQQGGHHSLQRFLQDVVSAVQHRQLEQQELLQLLQLAAAASGVFKAAPELYSMAVSAREVGAGNANAEMLVQLLQVLQPNWAHGIQQAAAAIGPGGRCEQQLQQLLTQQLLPRIQQCTPHLAVANILLAVAPQLAGEDCVRPEQLQATGLFGLLQTPRRDPFVEAAITNPNRLKALSDEMRALLIESITRPRVNVSWVWCCSAGGSWTVCM
jgi:hypothetical protein